MTVLRGHDDAWREWHTALGSARMHHAWMLVGPKGIGKATFAKLAAARLGAEHDTFLLKPLPANEAEEEKKAEGKPFQTRRNITVDQVRQLLPRLTKTLEPGQRRVVIIDPVDNLEPSAASALLKNLEEPRPGTFFLLVTHRPGRLLPTIRSRCRMLRFAPLTDAEVDRVLCETAPLADAAGRAAAVAAAKGSPGAALEFLDQDLGALHTLMRQLATEGDDHFALRGAFAEELGARPDRERQLATIDLACAVVSAGLGHDRHRDARAIAAHGELVKLSGQLPTYNFDPGLVAMEIGALLASLAMPRETA